MRGKIVVLTILAIVLPLAGFSCGGGGGGGEVSLEDLAGTWFGVMVDPVFEAHTYQFNIDPWGDMSGFYLDDVAFPTFAGTAYKESGRIFNFLMNDGTEGGFITDESGTHLAFLTENFQRGVMEKWATELPPVFEPSDYQGTWNGYSIWLDAHFEIDNEGATTFTIETDFDVLGTGLAGAFSGTFIPFAGEPDYGVLRGVIGSGGAYFEMAPSVDRTFMATLACVVSFDIEITDCEFGAYTKE